MNTRFTVEQLEQMKTHELADLLANVVLVLRRMPNVECKQLGQLPETIQLPAPSTPSTAAPAISNGITAQTLQSKTVPQLKKIATELHVSYTGRIKKDELIAKILSRQANGHSEQYAIQHL
jgi:Rho termination factor-like protein